MITVYRVHAGQLRATDELPDSADGVVWVDLLAPDIAEEAAVERLMGIDVPTREEMEEIEISSRLYAEDGALFMTASIPAMAESPNIRSMPVTFILVNDRLITVRYHEPRAFQTFRNRVEKSAAGCDNGETVLIALLEAVVDRLADILEGLGRDIDAASRGVFGHSGTKPTKGREFQAVLSGLGVMTDRNSSLRESLVTLERLAGFLAADMTLRKAAKPLRERVRTLSRDIRSLADHGSFLEQKIGFLLDATLGMINIEQNAIIKIFSVAAVVFLPPTLIASIYGMNFRHMPELDWLLGYPMALILMVVSALIPFWFFKRKGWL